MKNLIIVIPLVFSSLTLFSQSENDVQSNRMKFGFNFGINYALLSSISLPSNSSISNNIGGRLGVLGDYKMSNIIHISPKAELSFNNADVKYSNPDQSQTKYRIMPINLDLITHFVFKDKRKKMSPYFFFGPNFRIPLSKTNNPIAYATKPNFAIDFGIGMDKKFTFFNFSPEIRYSYGVSNVNQNPLYQSLKFHNLSLVFNLIE